MQSSTHSPALRHGFIAFPRAIFDQLLCIDLTKRELSVCLLLARLTYGCRNAGWATLRQADLAAVGIGANHARACLERLLNKGGIACDAEGRSYQIARGLVDAGNTMLSTESERVQGLASLIARQLAHMKEPRSPEMGSRVFLKREEIASQNGNTSGTSVWKFSPSRQRFVRAADIAKERREK